MLAGGGTGGHIYPNAAIAERLIERAQGQRVAFVVSDRAVDARVRESLSVGGADWVVSAARPLGRSVRGVLGFGIGWRRAVKAARARYQRERPLAVVATGGFVSGPEIEAARGLGIPTALVSLDATPGRAIRRLAPRVDRVFSAYATLELPMAEVIGFPLRREVMVDVGVAEARERLGLDPERPVLLVTAGSQGATTVNLGMARALDETGLGGVLSEGGWQVLHLTGEKDVAEVSRAYVRAGVPALISKYKDEMGLVWRAAELAVARPGASSVAEAWANGVPTVFLPYPFHRDEHQRLNAEPMVAAGGAVLLRDLVRPEANAKPLKQAVCDLVRDVERLGVMRERLMASGASDGAAVVARWVLERAGRGG